MASPDIFLASCDIELFDRTVRSPVDFREFPDRPDAFQDLETTRLFGVEAGTSAETHYDKMKPGDLVLFYNDGLYIGTGRVGKTIEDDDQWASFTFLDDAPFSLLYTIEDFTAVSVPKAAVNEIFDYNAGYTPHGLMRVAENRVTNQPAAIERAIEKYTQRNA